MDVSAICTRRAYFSFDFDVGWVFFLFFSMNSLSKSLSEKCIAIYVTITVFDIEGVQKGKTVLLIQFSGIYYRKLVI